MWQWQEEKLSLLPLTGSKWLEKHFKRKTRLFKKYLGECLSSIPASISVLNSTNEITNLSKLKYTIVKVFICNIKKKTFLKEILKSSQNFTYET